MKELFWKRHEIRELKKYEQSDFEISAYTKTF